jgi:hypothetical protein
MTGLHTMSRHHCEHIVDDFLKAHRRVRPAGQPQSQFLTQVAEHRDPAGN